jgi:FkbM family methyltransferase
MDMEATSYVKNEENLLKGLRWVLSSLKKMRKLEEFNLDFRFLYKELTDPSFRMQNFLRYNSIGGEVAINRYGLKFSNRTPTNALQEIFVEKVYSSYPEFIPSKKETVVDVGAQYGDYSIFLAKYIGVKKVYSFEPLVENYNIFKENIKLNNITNIEPYNIALGDKTSEVERGILDNMITISESETKSTIKIEKLDNIPSIQEDFLKIDVEGFEMEVLNGAIENIKANMPNIIIEVHSYALKAEVKKFLGDLGYKLRHKNGFRRDPLNGMNMAENLFFSK